MSSLGQAGLAAVRATAEQSFGGLEGPPQVVEAVEQGPLALIAPPSFVTSNCHGNTAPESLSLPSPLKSPIAPTISPNSRQTQASVAPAGGPCRAPAARMPFGDKSNSQPEEEDRSSPPSGTPKAASPAEQPVAAPTATLPAKEPAAGAAAAAGPASPAEAPTAAEQLAAEDGAAEALASGAEAPHLSVERPGGSTPNEAQQEQPASLQECTQLVFGEVEPTQLQLVEEGPAGDEGAGQPSPAAAAAATAAAVATASVYFATQLVQAAGPTQALGTLPLLATQAVLEHMPSTCVDAGSGEAAAVPGPPGGAVEDTGAAAAGQSPACQALGTVPVAGPQEQAAATAAQDAAQGQVASELFQRQAVNEPAWGQEAPKGQDAAQAQEAADAAQGGEAVEPAQAQPFIEPTEVAVPAREGPSAGAEPAQPEPKAGDAAVPAGSTNGLPAGAAAAGSPSSSGRSQELGAAGAAEAWQSTAQAVAEAERELQQQCFGSTPGRSTLLGSDTTPHATEASW